MAIVAVCGDAATTTAVALAAGWPAADDVVLLEADPSGGDLAAWFDMPVEPSLSHVVTAVRDRAWPEIERLTRVAPCGIRVIPAPARAAESRQAVAEATRTVAATCAARRQPVVVVDVGSLPPVADPNPFIEMATAIVVTHRQATQSAPAAAVRLQRLADDLALLFRRSQTALIVAVVGTAPYRVDEVNAFLADNLGAGDAGEFAVVGLAVDELAAAVYAGRAGVSARRLERLPLSRTGREAAAVVAAVVEGRSADLWRATR